LDSLLQELIIGLLQDNTYFAERVSLDMTAALFVNSNSNSIDSNTHNNDMDIEESDEGDDDDDLSTVTAADDESREQRMLRRREYNLMKYKRSTMHRKNVNSTAQDNSKSREYLSERVADVTKRLYNLRQKQLILQSNVLDTLKVGLQQKLDEEDAYCCNSFAFMHDDPNYTAADVDQLQKITALLIDKFGADTSYFSVYLQG